MYEIESIFFNHPVFQQATANFTTWYRHFFVEMGKYWSFRLARCSTLLWQSQISQRLYQMLSF